MNGKKERRKGSAKRPRKPAPRHTGGERLPQQLYRQQVKQPRIQGVEHDACQMVACRIDPPQKIVKSESHPGEGDVMAHVRRGEHPPELGPAQPPVVKVRQDVFIVIEVHEPILQRGEIDEGGQQDNENRCQPLGLPRRRFTGGRGDSLTFSSSLALQLVHSSPQSVAGPVFHPQVVQRRAGALGGQRWSTRLSYRGRVQILVKSAFSIRHDFSDRLLRGSADLDVVEERVHKDLRETVGHAIPKPTGREQTSNEIPVTYAQPSSCRYVTCLPQLGKCL